MGVKVRYIDERWVKKNGTAEKVKLKTPYWAVFVDYKGKRKFIKAEGKREALLLARDIEKGLLREEWSDSEDDPGAVLFQDYSARWLDGKKATRSPGTGDSYAGILSNHLIPRFGAKALREITRADVRQFAVEKIDAGLKGGTVKTMLTILQGILGQAVEDNILAVNDASRNGKFIPKQPKKEAEIFPPDAIEAVLRVAREKDPDIYPALLFGFRAGLRIGEISALAWEDVDFDSGSVMVRRTNNKGHIGPPKGKRERRIPLSPELDAALRTRRGKMAEKALRTGTRWIYPNRLGEPVRDEWIRRRFSKCIVEAGFPATGKFHLARHTFTSNIIEEGAPLTMVRDLLGHVELTTTNLYAHSVSDAKEYIGKLDRIGKDANPRKQEGEPGGEVQEI